MMPREVTRSEVQRLLADGAQFVEVLPTEDYEEEHLRGAINVPLKTLDRQTTGQLDRNWPIVVYCHDSQ